LRKAVDDPFGMTIVGYSGQSDVPAGVQIEAIDRPISRAPWNTGGIEHEYYNSGSAACFFFVLHLLLLGFCFYSAYVKEPKP
jgi:hypothetical protein